MHKNSITSLEAVLLGIFLMLFIASLVASIPGLITSTVSLVSSGT